MFTQNQFFRILSLTVLFFFSRALCAVAPQKTGFQHHAIATDAPQWDLSALIGVALIGLVAFCAFKIAHNEKPARYDN